MIRFTDKQQFIDALEARRPWARDYDRRQTAEHKVAEKEALSEYRARCRELSKLSYADLKAYDDATATGATIRFQAPSCPTLQEARIDAVLANLSLTRQKVFTVDQHGPWRGAYFLLTHDENRKATAC